jgi:formylglycine-generating enzyme required for sulfatase activity
MFDRRRFQVHNMDAAGPVSRIGLPYPRYCGRDWAQVNHLGVPFGFAHVAAGRFLMGSNDLKEDEKPQHQAETSSNCSVAAKSK